VGLVDRTLAWLGLARAPRDVPAATAITQPSYIGWSGSGLSHGYVHEPYSGAWQQNVSCGAPGGLFSAVYACMQIISGDIAKLQPRIRRRLDNGSKIHHDMHPAARVLWHPNEYQTRVDFWGQFMASALFTGNTYAYLIRDERGVIQSMHLLDPRKVTPLVADDGSVFYRIGGEPLASIDAENTVPARFIMHHRLLALTHPLVGLSPWVAAGVSAATGQQIQHNSSAFFANMSRPSGLITLPGRADEPTLNRLRTDWNQNFTHGNQGRTAILDQGMKWEAMTMTAADAQLIEQLRWSVEDVARVFRVPLYMLTDASKISFKNAEQLSRNYYSQTLQYHIEALEARIDETFGLAEDVYCEFDLSTLLRMEFDARVAAYQTAIQCGVLTINEARALEELPPKEGGNEPLIQMQYVPLSMAGLSPTPPPPPSETPPDEADENEADEELDEESERAVHAMLRAYVDRRMGPS